MASSSHLPGELGKQPLLPPDVLDQIAAMQKAIDKLTAELASVMLPPLPGHGEVEMLLSLFFFLSSALRTGRLRK